MSRLSESTTSVDAEVEISPSSDDQERQKRCSSCIKSPRKRTILLSVVIAILAAVVGGLVGYFVPRLLNDSCPAISSAREDVDEKFADEVSTKELEDNLR